MISLTRSARRRAGARGRPSRTPHHVLKHGGESCARCAVDMICAVAHGSLHSRVMLDEIYWIPDGKDGWKTAVSEERGKKGQLLVAERCYRAVRESDDARTGDFWKGNRRHLQL